MAAGPAPDNAANIFPAVELNNRAMALCHAGNHVAAERLHHQALGIKITAFGADSIQAALSFNALGQEQRHLGNLVDAEANLKEAVRIRNEIGSPFDGAVSRENLAQVYEEKGDLAAAKELRLTKPLEMACANEDVSASCHLDLNASTHSMCHSVSATDAYQRRREEMCPVSRERLRQVFVSVP